MPTVTLLAKIYAGSQLGFVGKSLKSKTEGLRVEAKRIEHTPRGWIKLEISGEEENVALRYLAEEIGLCPERLENVDKFSTIKGRIMNLNLSNERLYVDVGVFSPDIVDAAIPLHNLQAQLADGRKIALKKCAELFGFCENLPLITRIVSVDREKNSIEAELAEKQVKQYADWTKSLLDRLIVLGVPQFEVRSALERAGFARDIVEIEPLGLLECAVVCKLGTEAAGLIPRIGRRLRNAAFSIFSPRRVRTFFGDFSFL
jgi:hypothetical protein